jgi:hypothetical protein
MSRLGQLIPRFVPFLLSLCLPCPLTASCESFVRVPLSFSCRSRRRYAIDIHRHGSVSICVFLLLVVRFCKLWHRLAVIHLLFAHISVHGISAEKSRVSPCVPVKVERYLRILLHRSLPDDPFVLKLPSHSLPPFMLRPLLFLLIIV